MSLFLGSLTTRKVRNQNKFKCSLRVTRQALCDSVIYTYVADSIQDASRHALYLMLNDVSNIDGLNIHDELHAANKRTYSDVRNCIYGYAVNVTREAYHGDVIDRMYVIDTLIAATSEDAPITPAQCAIYCSEVSAYNRRFPSKQRTFIYRIRGGKVVECYANGKAVTTLNQAKQVHEED